MAQVIPKSRSRKVNGYVKAVLALEAVRRKREERYDRCVRTLDRKRDCLVADVETRRRALTGGQLAEARWILDAIPTINAFKDGEVRYEAHARKAEVLATRARSVRYLVEALGQRAYVAVSTAITARTGLRAGRRDGGDSARSG